MGKKSLFIIIITLALILIFAPASMAAEASAGLDNFNKVTTYVIGQFTDVPSTAWFSDNVACAYELGLMKGSSAAYFNASGNVTLAEAVAMAARIHSIYMTGEEHFCQDEPWYQVYADYCIDTEMINSGYTDYTRPATRAEFAAILANALPDKALTAVNIIEDGAIPDISAYAAYRDAVYKLYRAGILTGNDASGAFAPGSTICRNAAAAIVTRMADASLRKSIDLTASEIKNYDAYVDEVVRLVNAARAEAGVSPLSIDPLLCEAAMIRTAEIQDQFSHTRPDGSRCLTVLDQVGVGYGYAGENIAIGYTTPETMMNALMNSNKGHRDNILNPHFKRIGIGIMVNESGAYGGCAWVQLFTD